MRYGDKDRADSKDPRVLRRHEFVLPRRKHVTRDAAQSR